MKILLAVLLAACLLLPRAGAAQNSEKVIFDAKDTTDGYYLAVPPSSKAIKGVVVLFCSFTTPESLLPDTRIPQVAAANGILTVLASVKEKLYADTAATARMNQIIRHVAGKYPVDTARFAFGGYDYAGNVLLRYAELTFQYPNRFPVRPKAVFAVDSFADLAGLWHWSERQIKKNYSPGTVADSKFIVGKLRQEIGSPQQHAARYQELSAFYRADEAPGNERYLKNTPVRLYYDADIAWHLKKRGNGYYDTALPDASEMISRLLVSGNKDAEFVASAQPGMRTNGTRNPNTLSIVDEVEFIDWIKGKLDIFDPVSWEPPYHLPAPEGWATELFALPPEFAPGIALRGSEDIRFMPGWDKAGKEDYWSYSYLWWVEGDPALTARRLEQYLTEYYEGLVSRNIGPRKIPRERVVPTRVAMKQAKAEPGDKDAYRGTIHMLDYQAENPRPIVLNCSVYVKECTGAGRTAVFFEVSPQPASHAVWQKMTEVRRQFGCKKLPGSGS